MIDMKKLDRKTLKEVYNQIIYTESEIEAKGNIRLILAVLLGMNTEEKIKGIDFEGNLYYNIPTGVELLFKK